VYYGAVFEIKKEIPGKISLKKWCNLALKITVPTPKKSRPFVRRYIITLGLYYD
jgi:hypothetical protein